MNATAGNAVLSEAQPIFSTFAEGSSECVTTASVWEMLSTARNLLPDERVAKCQYAISPSSGSVTISASERRAFFSNLIRCESPSCPFCARAWSEEQRHRLQLAVREAFNQGLFLTMVTFTLQHTKHRTLQASLDGLTGAYNQAFSGRWYTQFCEKFHIVGRIKTIEVTYGKSGWHPHLHVIFLSEYEFFEPIEYEDPNTGYMLLSCDSLLDKYKSDITERWQSALKKQGFVASKQHGIDIKIGDYYISDYVTKFGRHPVNRQWGMADEMSKANTKKPKQGGFTPFGLLAVASGDPSSIEAFSVLTGIHSARLAIKRASELYIEYFQAMKGTQRIAWSKGLAKMLDIPRLLIEYDMENVSTVEEYKIIATVSIGVWKMIRNHPTMGDLRETVLDVALEGESALSAFFERLGFNDLRDNTS